MAGKMKVTRCGWIDEDGHVLALFGTEKASAYLFELLTDEQAANFLRLMEGNAFIRPRNCIDCETELFAGNNVCPKCGLDNEDK